MLEATPILVELYKGITFAINAVFNAALIDILAEYINVTLTEGLFASVIVVLVELAGCAPGNLTELHASNRYFLSWGFEGVW